MIDRIPSMSLSSVSNQQVEVRAKINEIIDFVNRKDEKCNLPHRNKYRLGISGADTLTNLNN